MVTDKNKISQSGIVPYYISDHSGIFCSIKKTKTKFQIHNNIKLRSMKNYNRETFVEFLEQIDWSPILNINDVDIAWLMFKNALLNVIDEIAPVKHVRIKQNSQPWINNEILENIKKRDKIFKSFKTHKTEELYISYSNLRNKISEQIKVEKNNYFKNLIEEAGSCPKKVWKTLNEFGMTGKSKIKNENIGLRDVNGEIEFDKKRWEIASTIILQLLQMNWSPNSQLTLSMTHKKQ
jgi:hypothetical protein